MSSEEEEGEAEVSEESSSESEIDDDIASVNSNDIKVDF